MTTHDADSRGFGAAPVSSCGGWESSPMTKPPAKPTLVRCRNPDCNQVVARITGDTIRPIGDVSVRHGKLAVVCPACGERKYISREAVAKDTEAA